MSRNNQRWPDIYCKHFGALLLADLSQKLNYQTEHTVAVLFLLWLWNQAEPGLTRFPEQGEQLNRISPPDSKSEGEKNGKLRSILRVR